MKRLTSQEITQLSKEELVEYIEEVYKLIALTGSTIAEQDGGIYFNSWKGTKDEFDKWEALELACHQAYYFKE